MPVSSRGQICRDLTKVARAWAGIDRHARIVIDEGGLAVWLNDRAKAMIGGKTGLSLRHRMLSFSSASLREAFDTFLASLVPTSLSVVEFPGATPAEHLLVRAFRIASAHGSLFCLEIQTGHCDRPIAYVNLEHALGLTRTEHRIALALLDGGQPSDIAMSHRISLETVRTHVKNIYQKVGVARNGAFHAALRRFQY